MKKNEVAAWGALFGLAGLAVAAAASDPGPVLRYSPMTEADRRRREARERYEFLDRLAREAEDSARAKRAVWRITFGASLTEVWEAEGRARKLRAEADRALSDFSRA